MMKLVMDRLSGLWFTQVEKFSSGANIFQVSTGCDASWVEEESLESSRKGEIIGTMRPLKEQCRCKARENQGQDLSNTSPQNRDHRGASRKTRETSQRSVQKARERRKSRQGTHKLRRELLLKERTTAYLSQSCFNGGWD